MSISVIETHISQYLVNSHDRYTAIQMTGKSIKIVRSIAGNMLAISPGGGVMRLRVVSKQQGDNGQATMLLRRPQRQTARSFCPGQQGVIVDAQRKGAVACELRWSALGHRSQVALALVGRQQHESFARERLQTRQALQSSCRKQNMGLIQGTAVLRKQVPQQRVLIRLLC